MPCCGTRQQEAILDQLRVLWVSSIEQEAEGKAPKQPEYKTGDRWLYQRLPNKPVGKWLK